MELEKLVAAIGISIFLVALVGDVFMLVYPAPKYPVYNDYYTPATSCGRMITDACGSSYNSAYYNCSRQITSSQEYVDCQTSVQNQNRNAQANYQAAQDAYKEDIQTYRIVSMILCELLGIVIILLGFLVIKAKSIGSGFILAGICIFFAGGMIYLFSTFSASFSSLLNSGSSDVENTTKVIGISGELIALIILILFSYFRLEQENTN